MAKQKFEYKKVINLCGVLNKDENDEWIITVEEKDDSTTYLLKDFLQEANGYVVSIGCDIEL